MPHCRAHTAPLARSPRAVRLQAAAARRFAGAAAVRGTVRVALAAASRAAASAVVVVLLPLLLLLVAAASAAAVCRTRQEEDRVHHELAANNLRLIPQGIALRYHVEFRHNSHVRIFCEAGSPAMLILQNVWDRRCCVPMGNRLGGLMEATVPPCHVAMLPVGIGPQWPIGLICAMR